MPAVLEVAFLGDNTGMMMAAADACVPRCLGDNPGMMMAVADAIIHFWQPLADEFCMVQN